MDGEIGKKLAEIVGPENVSTSITDREAYAFVPLGQDMPIGRPDIVALPKTAEQVSEILTLANKHGIPVVVRGRGTGFLGENVVLRGGILLDMSNMDGVVDIDEENLVVIVEGGCGVLKLFYELDRKDLALPIRTWFTPNMTVAGLVANNGTGDYSSSYGRLGESVLGLEVVLPTGDIVRLGSWANPHGYGPWTRFAGGPDLIGLFVGSIGALGVITKVALRLVNKRKFIWYRTFGWPREGIEQMSRAIYWLQRNGVSNMSLHNYWTMRGPMAGGFVKLPPNIYFVLNLMKVGEDEKETKFVGDRIRQRCEANGGKDLGAEICKSCHGPPYYLMNLNQFYRFRGRHEEGLAFKMFYHCCPTLRFPFYWRAFEMRVKRYGFLDSSRGPYLYAWFLPPASINPFPTFAYRAENAKEVAMANRAYREISEYLIKNGVVPYTIGSFQPKIALTSLGPAYRLMRSIKGLLDPRNILNPGQL